MYLFRNKCLQNYSVLNVAEHAKSTVNIRTFEVEYNRFVIFAACSLV